MSIKNVVNDSKSLWLSRTIWVAVIQSLLALIAIWQGLFPQWVAYLALANSALYILLRVITTKPVAL